MLKALALYLIISSGILIGFLAEEVLSQEDKKPAIQLYEDGTWDCEDGTLNCLLVPPSPEVTVLPTLPATALPKPTASPVPTATPLPNRCVVKVTTSVLNIRSGPGSNFADVGDVILNQLLTVEDSVINTSTGARWYKIYDGYIHSGYTEYVQGDCNFGTAAILTHVVPGYNEWELNVANSIYAANGYQFGIKTYSGSEQCERTVGNGGICIYRIPLFGSDCPDMGPTVDNDPKEQPKIGWQNIAA